MTQVSWSDAVEFCNQLSDRWCRGLAYDIGDDGVDWDREINGFRLPTEAEWEYAARAGTQQPYPGSHHAALVGWFAGNAGMKPHPVGEKNANAWGLFDMAGNVSEWVGDWLAPYPEGDVTDPVGPPEGKSRVIRGGSCMTPAERLRTACRSWNGPKSHLPDLGFRLCLFAPQKPVGEGASR